MAARNEAWKYTSLRQLERRAFAAAPLQGPALDAALLDDIPAPRLVFVNGRLDAALSDVQALPSGVQLQPLSVRWPPAKTPCVSLAVATNAAKRSSPA